MSKQRKVSPKQTSRLAPMAIFRFTHRHVVVLCAVDGAIGYSLGSLFGIEYTGAVIGALFGIINFFVLNQTLFRLVLK